MSWKLYLILFLVGAGITTGIVLTNKETEEEMDIVVESLSEIEQPSTTVIINADGSTTELLDQRTEQICYNETCNWVQYQGETFPEVNNTLMYFSNFTSAYIQDNVIFYEFLDGTIVKIIPILHYGDTLYYLNETPVVVPDHNITVLRDYVKFQTQIVKTNPVHGIGFIYDSNKPIRYKIENRTDLITGNVRFNYQDLLDENFTVEFTTENNTLWIPLDDYPNGVIKLDPNTLIYTNPCDGYCRYYIATGCSGCYNTTNLLSLQWVQNVGGSGVYFEEAFTLYNTSSIPDDATVIKAEERLYITNNVGIGGGCPAYEHRLYYYSGKTNYNVPFNLTCADAFLYTTLESAGGIYNLLPWSSPYYEYWTIFNTSINLTGYTGFRHYYIPTPIANGESCAFTVAAADGYSTRFEPLLNITYTEAVSGCCGTTYTSGEDGDWYITGDTNCTNEECVVNGSIYINESSTLKLDNATIYQNLSLNKLFIEWGSKILIFANSSITEET